VRPAQLNPPPLCTQFTPRGSAPAANRAGPTPAGDLSSGALIARPPSPPRACSTRPGAAAAAPGSPRHYRTCMGGFRSGRVGQHLVARILDLPQPRNETPSPEVSTPYLATRILLVSMVALPPRCPRFAMPAPSKP
jgi:hypothetical protein